MAEQKSIYSRTVEPKKETVTARSFDDPETQKLLREDKFKPRHHFASLAEKAAKSSIYDLNWYWPGGAAAFPYEPDLQMVDSYFRYADGGPLLVDEPEDKDALEGAKKKQKKIRELGFRHIIIEHGATLEDVMFSIEEADKAVKEFKARDKEPCEGKDRKDVGNTAGRSQKKTK